MSTPQFIFAVVLGAALLHVGYNLFLIRAYEHGDLSQVYPPARGAAPLMVALIDVTFLGEVMGRVKTLAVVVIAFGVVLMSWNGGRNLASFPSTAIACALATRGGEAALGRLLPARRSGLTAGSMSLGSCWIAIWAFTQAPIARSPPCARPAYSSPCSSRINVERHRPIWVLSDEAYREIVFSDGRFEPPLSHIRRSAICYSYGKRLLTPGQRLGYFAVNPAAPEREAVREAMFLVQMATGWNFPSALMQYAIEDLETLVIDMPAMERRRGRLCAGLEAAGYRVTRPQGSFYALVETPGEEASFCDRLAALDVFVMPGAVCGIPGHVRLSLTASDAMVEDALPRFAAVMAELRARAA